MISASGFFHTIILLGALQGIFTGCLLFFQSLNRYANRFLAIAIWLMAIASLNIYLTGTGIYSVNSWTIIHSVIPMIIVMPIGPLIYFYTVAIFDSSFKLNRKQRFYFLPIIIDIIPQLTVIIFFIGVWLKWIDPNPQPWGKFVDDYNVYSDIPRWLSLTFYLWLSARHISSLESSKHISKSVLKWLKLLIRIFLMFQIIWLVYLVPYSIPRYTDAVLNTFSWYPVYIPLAVIIYWIGIKAYIISYRESIVMKKATVVLSDDVIQDAVSRLIKSMEEDGLYLNPDLNPAVLAEHTRINQKILSAVLNQHLHKSFNEFVNEYRVEAIKKKLEKNELNNFTILAVAMECGFNSKATFQRTFKQITGLSPSEFRKSMIDTG